MSDVVIDSSVAVKWLIPEPDSGQADLIAAEAATKGTRLLVLDLALVEVGNALWKKYHFKQAAADQTRRLLQELQARVLHIEPAQRLFTPALEIAMKYDRALYDARFVALADDLKLPGVTADEPLVKAVSQDYPSIVLLRGWKP